MLKPTAEKIKINLKKMAGMLKLIEGMVDGDRYCVDIGQQINAAMGILRQTNNLVLENHLNTCGGHKLSSKNKAEKDAFIKELIQAFAIVSK